jgi:hypothetical protein
MTLTTGGTMVVPVRAGAAVLRSLEQAVEATAGMTAEQLRSQTVSEFREKLYRKNGNRLHIGTKFPLIGRGNIMRERILDNASIEHNLMLALST